MTRFFRLLIVLLCVGWCAARFAEAADWKALAENAKDDFTPVTEADVELARQQLGVRAVALEQALMQAGSDQAELWKEYLAWSDVQKQLAPDSELDLAALQETLRRLRSGEPGLELDSFRQAADAVQHLLDLGSVRRAKDQADFLGKQLDVLVKQLKKADDNDEDGDAGVDLRTSYQIELRLDLLAGLKQSQELEAALRQNFGGSNMLVSVSELLMCQLVRRPVVNSQPVNDVILGTRIRGTGNTRGELIVQTSPSASTARLLFQLSGNIHSETVGRNGPAVIRSSADSPIMAHKSVDLSPEKFVMYGSSVRASTQSRTRSVSKAGGGLGSRLVSRIGRKRVNESRGQANAIASRKAERRVASSFDQQVNDAILQARHQYDKAISKPLRARGATPARFLMHTDSHSLGIDLLHADRGQLGADSPSPPQPRGDVTLRLHQSSVNNLATVMVGGAVIEQLEEDEPPTVKKVKTPPWLKNLLEQRNDKIEAKGDAKKDEPDFKPWSMTLRRTRPFSLQIEPGNITAIVHVAELKSGKDSYRGWDLIVKFRPIIAEGKWQLERIGDIDVLPTSFDPQGKRGLRGRNVAMRRNLAKQINARSDAGLGLPKVIDLPPINLSQLNKPGLRALTLDDISTSDGWLVLAWDAG